MNLIQVAYDPASNNELVNLTLQTKVVSQSDVGIGPVSCWAGVAYRSNGVDKIATGFSQMKNDLAGTSPYKNSWVKYHGELAALAQALYIIEQEGFTGGALPILAVYIEMSPCQNCMPHIQGMLPDGTDVYYSFDYATESANWVTAARALCS